MLYMVIERFQDPLPVYRRFREQGRMMPPGLTYIVSWVTTELNRCYQVMECNDRRLLDEWMAKWADLASFEVIPVLSSAEAAERVLGGS